MTPHTLKRIFIGIAGSTVLLVGVALLVLPGPGWLTIFAGVGILSTEFMFARNLVERTRRLARRTARRMGLSDRWCQKLRLTPPQKHWSTDAQG